MPVTSSSVPPRGRRISICSSDSGKTTHSRPRALTSDPTAKLMLFSLICSNTATPHPQGDRKGPIPASTQPPPLQRYGTTYRILVVFVRAGVVWRGVGTLAVALGGEAWVALASLGSSSGPLVTIFLYIHGDHHSTPRATVSSLTGKATATQPPPEGDRALPDRQGNGHPTPPRGRPRPP